MKTSVILALAVGAALVAVCAVWMIYENNRGGEVSEFTVLYDVNGGTSGSGPADVIVQDGTTVTLSLSGPIHADDGGVAVLFVGWSISSISTILEAADTSELSSLVTSVTVDGADVTVYAVWGYDRDGNGIPDVSEFTVFYDVNGGTVGSGPADVIGINGTTVTLSLSGPIHADDSGVVVLFVGWSLSPVPTILEAADTSELSSLVTSVTINGADATVYAVWGYDRDGNGIPDVLDIQFTVFYDVNGGTSGSGPSDVTNLLDGAVVTLSSGGPTHTDDGGTAVLFVGWSTSRITTILEAADTSTLSSLASSVTINGESTTAYAVWGYDRDGNGTPDVLDTQFSVTYNVNGGNAGSAPAPITNLLDGSVVTLSSVAPTHLAEGSVAVLFVGWSLSLIGTTLSVSDTSELASLVTSVTISGTDATVYAVWGYDTDGNEMPDVLDIQFTVTYDVNNGNTGSGPSDVTNLLNAAVVTLSLSGPTHADDSGVAVLFVGWSLSPVPTILEAADTSILSVLVSSVTINSGDATVYAVWGYDRDGNGIPDVLDIQFTVFYDENNGNFGSGPSPVTNLLDGAVVTLSSSEPTHAFDNDKGVAVLFIGWSLTQITTIFEDTDKAMLPPLVTLVTIDGDDVTVYAVWGYDRDANGIPDVLEV